MDVLHLINVPDYLKEGELYRTLIENDDGQEIHFPHVVLKPNRSVNSSDDCNWLLNSLRYWGFDTVPHEIISFALKNKKKCTTVLQQFVHEFPTLQTLLEVIHAPKPKQTQLALKKGDIMILSCLVEQDRSYPLIPVQWPLTWEEMIL